MEKYKIYNHNGTEYTGAAYSGGILFSFLTKENKLCLKSNFLSCKDHVNDFLYSVARPKNKVISAEYGVNGTALMPDLTNFRLCVYSGGTGLTNKEMHARMLNSVAISNNMLKNLGMKDRLKIDNVIGYDETSLNHLTHVISIPRILRKMPPIISAIMSIVRLKATTNCNTIEGIFSYISGSSDSIYLKNFKHAYEFLKTRNMYKFFKGRMIDNWQSCVGTKGGVHGYFGCSNFGIHATPGGGAKTLLDGSKNYGYFTRCVYGIK